MPDSSMGQSVASVQAGQTYVYEPYGTQYQVLCVFGEWAWVLCLSLRSLEPKTQTLEFLTQPKMRLKYDLEAMSDMGLSETSVECPHCPPGMARIDCPGHVYVDDAFVEGGWGKWSGGGHLQADRTDALHEFASTLGLKREWFQSRPGRPDHDHYDLTRAKRDAAILAGAIPEAVEDGTARRRATREAVRDA